MSSRIEVKYLLDEKKFLFLQSILPSIMAEDSHSLGGGYPVTSLYYDTKNFKAYYDKVEGESSKEKWRLRKYAGDQFHLEHKTKLNHLSSKRMFSFQDEDHFPSEVKMREPKLLVKYQRRAFFDRNLRVTLDSDLSYSKASHYLDIFLPDSSYESDQVYVLEVKSPSEERFPVLHRIIKDLRLKSSPFSKYGHGVEQIYGL